MVDATPHGGCYANAGAGKGWGGMLTFPARAHMVDATPMLGLGWGGVGCKCLVHVHTWWLLRQCWGWGGVGCICTRQMGKLPNSLGETSETP